jgi:hypothetical protein
MAGGGVSLEYLGIFLYKEEDGNLAKLADTLSLRKTSDVDIKEPRVIKDLEAYFVGQIEDDEHETRLFIESRMDLTVYVFYA